MAESPSIEAGSGKGLPTLVGELWDMVLAYLKQETLEPLKGLARFVALGLAGTFLLSIGCVLLTLAGLRALQFETGGTFAGNLSWAPYLIALAGCIIVGAVAARAIGARRRRARRQVVAR